MVLSDDVLGIVCNRVDISDLSNGKSLPNEIMQRTFHSVSQSTAFPLKQETKCDRRLIRVQPFFGKPHGTVCQDNRYEQYTVTNKVSVPYRVVEKESAYFDFDVNKITSKNISSNFDTLQDYSLITLPAPAHDLKQGRKEIYLKS